MPCFDLHAADNVQSSKTVLMKGQSNHGAIDLCSPFCYCTCCQSLFDTSLEGFIPSELIGYNVDIPFLIKNHTIPFISFWRPPKI